MVKQAVILCAGRGERLRPITDTIPKPMVDVAGRPFVSYAVEVLHKMGVEDIVLSVNYLREAFDLEGVRYSEGQDTPNKSVSAVPNLMDEFVLLNGDVFPILRWKDYLSCTAPTVAIKTTPKYSDVGICTITPWMLFSLDCGSISSLIYRRDFNLFAAYSDISIDTLEKLEKARTFMSWWWTGKSPKAMQERVF